MSTQADANSITLSSPKTVSVRLPAVMPAPIATVPSTIIHATVSPSRRKACWVSAARSGVSDAELADPQEEF